MVLIEFLLDFHAGLLLYFLKADSKEREIIICLPFLIIFLTWNCVRLLLMPEVFFVMR